jgi:hypothetical protein
VLSEIEGLTNPQPRAGKKDVSQEQKNLKRWCWACSTACAMNRATSSAHTHRA